LLRIVKLLKENDISQNWFFVKNSDFLIFLSIQPKVVDLRCFKPINSAGSNLKLWVCGKNSVPAPVHIYR